MSREIVMTYYVLAHIAFVVWLTFTLVYGVTRKWEETPEGKNAFITSCGLTLVFAIIVSGIYARLELWRGIAVLVAVAILIGAGIQRISFLWKTRKRKAK